MYISFQNHDLLSQPHSFMFTYSLSVCTRNGQNHLCTSHYVAFTLVPAFTIVSLVTVTLAITPIITVASDITSSLTWTLFLLSVVDEKGRGRGGRGNEGAMGICQEETSVTRGMTHSRFFSTLRSLLTSPFIILPFLLCLLPPPPSPPP